MSDPTDNGPIGPLWTAVRELEEGAAHVDSVRAAVRELQARADGSDRGQDGLFSRFGEIEAWASRLESRLAKLEALAPTNEQCHARLADRLTKLEAAEAARANAERRASLPWHEVSGPPPTEPRRPQPPDPRAEHRYLAQHSIRDGGDCQPWCRACSLRRHLGLPLDASDDEMRKANAAAHAPPIGEPSPPLKWVRIGRAEERAAIVAWLRVRVQFWPAYRAVLEEFIGRIESGEHVETACAICPRQVDPVGDGRHCAEHATKEGK